MKRFLLIILIIFSLFLISCNSSSAQKEIILATTTSTNDSGLLEVLLPAFEKKTGYLVKIIAVGTGKALAMGEDGNADVLLVHAPDSELKLLDSQAVAKKDRYLVMHNDFIIVGPANDPAGIRNSGTIEKVFNAISTNQVPFVSRGDDSGTHKKEKIFWQSININPSGDWYLEAGQGMGATLRIASEKQAYTITDRATYLALKQNLDLQILFENAPTLLNIYHVMIVNPGKFTTVNYKGGKAFADYLISKDTQKVIGNFGVDKYGSPLFFPDADKTDADLGL